MSQAAGITEFLSELNESDSLSALRSAHSEKSALVFKVDSHPTPIKTFIENFLDKRALLPSEANVVKIDPDKEVSIKFNVGTEVFFVKTFIKSHMNRYYFDMGSKVIQLKRRKEPRFMIPKKWAQTAAILGSSTKPEPIKCNVVDISLGGIRFEITQQHPTYQRDDIIKIKFQIYKRAEVSTMAIIRFILVRPNMNSIVGLEFAEITDVQKERVSHIVQDINMFNANTKQ